MVCEISNPYLMSSYPIIFYYIILCYIIVYYVILYYVICVYSILYYLILYYIVLYYIILCPIILYYIILCYTILYYIIYIYLIYINSRWKPHIFFVQATFFQRFATLSRGKVHLLAACQAERSQKWDDPGSWYSFFVNGRTRRELQIYHDLSSIFSVI